MDLTVGFYWLLAFFVIILFLGTLNYFIGRSHSDTQKSESQQIQQQSNKSRNQKKRARRQRQAAAAAAAAAKANENLDDDEDKDEETKSASSETNIKLEEDEDSAIQLTNENEDEFEDPIVSENLIPSAQEEEEEQEQEEPLVPVKQKTKNKVNRPNSKSTNHSNNENISSTKPQASVAPVKQSSPSFPSKSTESSTNTSQEKYPRTNENPQQYSYSGYKSIPPRFQQKDLNNRQKSRKKKSQQTPFSSTSIQDQNDFVSRTLKQQINKNHQSTNPNGYSSESDVLTESSSTVPPLSTESQQSLSPDNPSVNEFLSIFEQNSFSSDELNFLLNKLTTKYLTKKQDWQRTNKTDKTFERILDETYHSQAKILAIELQTEKNRLVELSKTNKDLENTLKKIQQPNPHLAQYQQTILQYQMEIRRITDENANLVQQLHAYSMMPMAINEFKQQQIVLNEQIKQLSARNCTLEQEIADGERAGKQAAEIYKKSDTQKQERIEQMMNDLNKYKKIDRDLSSLQKKHSEVEKNLTEKLNHLNDERDQLKIKCEQLKVQANETNEQADVKQLEEEFNELKTKNRRLKQRNAKILEELNKYSLEKNQNE